MGLFLEGTIFTVNRMAVTTVLSLIKRWHEQGNRNQPMPVRFFASVSTSFAVTTGDRLYPSNTTI